MTHLDPSDPIPVANTAPGGVPVTDREPEDGWPARLATALGASLELRDEYDAALSSQGALLDRIAVALHGEPPPLTTWSFHDLPELVAGLVAENARLFAVIAEADARVLNLRQSDADSVPLALDLHTTLAQADKAAGE